MPTQTKTKKGLSAASLLGTGKGAEKPAKSATKKRSRTEDEEETLNTFETLAPIKKSKSEEGKSAEASKAADNFKAPSGLPTRPTAASKSSGTEKTKGKKNTKSTGDAVSDGGSESDSSISVGYPSSMPSTPQDSSDFSFSSDFSDSDEGDESSVSMDEFANNTLEIKLDAKTTEDLQNKLKKTKDLGHQIRNDMKDKADRKGVIVLSHIPFGFFEEQMRGFFTQFGTVTRLRLSRAKKSGRSRGYAFVEFDDKEVAAIVAETMNDYLMYGRRLKCKVVPNDQVHPSTFLGSGRPRKDTTTERHLAHRLSHNRSKTQSQMDKNVRRLLDKEEKRRQKLEAKGVHYEFDGFAAQAPADLPDISALSAPEKSTTPSKGKK